jgi:hypothetical protein
MKRPIVSAIAICAMISLCAGTVLASETNENHPNAAKNVIFLYETNSSYANGWSFWLVSHGLGGTIQKASVAHLMNFTDNDLIIIGNDTGTVWSSMNSDAMTIKNSSKPVLAGEKAGTCISMPWDSLSTGEFQWRIS